MLYLVNLLAVKFPYAMVHYTQFGDASHHDDVSGGERKSGSSRQSFRSSGWSNYQHGRYCAVRGGRFRLHRSDQLDPSQRRSSHHCLVKHLSSMVFFYLDTCFMSSCDLFAASRQPQPPLVRQVFLKQVS